MNKPFEAPQERVRQAYQAWMASPNPFSPRKGLVAGQKTRNGIALGQALSHQTAVKWQEFFDAWIHEPDRIKVWSDHHLFHKNICSYSSRPFDTLEQMHEAFLANARTRVRATDFLLFQGDLSMGSTGPTRQWLEQCPGRKFLILGNHDVDRQEKTQALSKMGFEGIADCLWLPARAGSPELWLSHYPFHDELLPPGALNVHGHIHQNLIEGAFVNACVEHTDYAPVALLDLIAHQSPKAS